MLSVSQGGSTKKTDAFLKSMTKLPASIVSAMHLIGKQGVQALSVATPVNSGLAAHSWDYRVGQKDGKIFLIFTNRDIEGKFHVAIMLQYGYGTGTGGYVKGVDYINPAIKPIFDQIRDNVWKVVTSA